MTSTPITATTATPGVTPVHEDHDDEPKGFAQIPRWLQRDETISGNAKLVYIALSSRTDKYGQCHPSQETIARESSISVASVKRALQELNGLEVVFWEQRRRPGRGLTSNVYTVAVAKTRPVDNSPKPVAHSELPGVPVAQPDLGGSSQGAIYEREPLNEDSQSSAQRHPGGVVHNRDDDEKKSTPTPLEIITGRQVDISQVRAVLEKLTGEHVTTVTATKAAHLILVRAKRQVGNPTSYVVRSIENDSFEWQAWLFETDAKREQLAAETAGNDF